MEQDYTKYTAEDFEVWNILFERQNLNLEGKSSSEYLACLNELRSVLLVDEIPTFQKLSAFLYQKNGWTIEIVPGLIPVDQFFGLLAQKKFCSSTWLRKKSQLDYLEEPDMFHDIFGHIPLFMNKSYADFAQKMGAIGMAHKDNEQILLELQRLYWFSIEFGLMKSENKEKPLIYGAGIISSFGETNHIYEDEIEILPFNLEEIIKTDFCTSEIQMKYFLVNSFDDLYQSLSVYEQKLMN